MTKTIRRRMVRRRDERGVATLFVVLLAVAMLSMAGLVIDGGYAMAGNRKLTTQAQQAARIAADALNRDSLRDGGDPRVDEARARAAATAYLDRVGSTASRSIGVDGGTVSVRLEDRTDTAIMSAVGVTSLPIAGEGTATSIDADGP